MIKFVPIVCFLLSGFGFAEELLRFSDVFPIPGDNIEPFTITDAYGDVTLHVGKRVLLSDADVLDITPATGPDAEERKALAIKFNEEGTKKFARITQQLKGGRLAIVVNGELLMAPTILETIVDGSVEINGLEEAKARQLYDAFHAKSGKPPWPKDNPIWRNTPPMEKPQTVPYTEEEYQEIKKLRIGLGLYYLDSLPSNEELAKNLQVGMSHEEVIKLYGKPTYQKGGIGDPQCSGTWILAPEQCEPNPEFEMVPGAFVVEFGNGRVTKWSQTLRHMSRSEKVIGLEPSTLIATLPVVDFSKGELNWISYIEAIKIPDPSQSLNKRDLDELLTAVIQMQYSLPEEKAGSARISSDCDFMKILAHNFPEVGALIKQAVADKVEVGQLLSAVGPYLSGEKPLIPEAPPPPE